MSSPAAPGCATLPVVDGTDEERRQRAETYLRCRAEDELRRGPETRVAELARTLVDVGLIPEAIGRTVVTGFTCAQRARGIGQDFEVVEEPPAPLDIVLHSGETVELPWGIMAIRYVRFDEGVTRLSARVKITGDIPVSRLHPRGWDGPPLVQVGDDTGTTHEGHFYGGGSSGDWWEGTFDVYPGLSPSTRTLTIDGVRMVLGVPTPATATVQLTDRSAEPLSERALSYVEFVRETLEEPHVPGPTRAERAVSDLTGCGALPAGSTDRSKRGARSGAGQAPSPGRRRRGPRGVLFDAVALGVRIDLTRAHLLVEYLQPGNAGFEVELATSTNVAAFGADGFAAVPLAIDAEDDTGHRYRAEPSSWMSGEGSHQVTVRFEPELSPDANEVRLRFRSWDAVGVVTVRLVRSDAGTQR